jgi:hypothetical protein
MLYQCLQRFIHLSQLPFQDRKFRDDINKTAFGFYPRSRSSIITQAISDLSRFILWNRPRKVLGRQEIPHKFLGDRKGILAKRNQCSLIAGTDKYFSSGIFIYPEVFVGRRGNLLKNSPGANSVAQFDEHVILSCDCKQNNTVTFFVTEVYGAAIHSYFQYT